jgi:hypothetical protein
MTNLALKPLVIFTGHIFLGISRRTPSMQPDNNTLWMCMIISLVSFVSELFVPLYTIIFTYLFIKNVFRGRHGRDCMAIGFTTVCAISAYHH